MSLAGNLSDFDISYILQILSQEGKTGKLVLISDEEEGYIVFKKGHVISAGTNRLNPQSMVFQYLLKIRKYSSDEVAEIRALYHENLRYLYNKLLENNYLSLLELSTILETGIEDITCELFSWNRGNYRFETMPNVDSYQIGNFSISTDAIIMEAARREDEITRMGEIITRNTVFVRTENTAESNVSIDPISTLKNFPWYVYNLIDGTSPVEFICQESFFSEYQVYMALYELVEEKKITPLSDTISLTISHALKKIGETKTTRLSRILLSALSTIVFVIFSYIVGSLLIRDLMFSGTIFESNRLRSELSLSRAYHKIAIGTLQYQGNYGALPLSPIDLINKKILDKRDLKAFISSKE